MTTRTSRSKLKLADPHKMDAKDGPVAQTVASGTESNSSTDSNSVLNSTFNIDSPPSTGSSNNNSTSSEALAKATTKVCFPSTN
jgi:hypothetical protein